MPREKIWTQTEKKLEPTRKRWKFKVDTNQETMDAWLEEMKTWRKETTACQEATEPCLEKAMDSEKTTAIWKKWRLRWMYSKKD
jgi:hypothetical protein